MKKGTNWKRVFIHTDGKLLEQAERVLTAAGIETYARSSPTSHAKPQFRKHETHVFVQRGDLTKANAALVAAELVFESGIGA